MAEPKTPKPTEHPKPDRTPDRRENPVAPGPSPNQDAPKQPPVSPGPQPYKPGERRDS